MRFYPESIASFEHEPSKEDFRITRANNQIAECVISLVDFDIGKIVFGFTGTLTTKITQYTLQIFKELHIHDPYIMGKLAHSCSPNCICDMEKCLVIATKKIEKGDRITIDYEATEDVLFKSFQCGCKEPNCRNRIVGKEIRKRSGSNRKQTSELICI